MASVFQKIRFRPEFQVAGFRKWISFGSGMSDHDAEKAARYHLSEFFRQHDRNEVRALAEDTWNDRAPSFRLLNVQEQPGLNTKIVKFVETKNSIPIFGSNLVVELGQNRELISINGQLTRVEDVDSVAKISDRDALESLEEFTNASGLRVGHPEKQFFLDDKSKWHLVYHFRNVPAAPPQFENERPFGQTARGFAPQFDYFVDANDGSIVEHYRSRHTENGAASAYSSG